MRRSERTRQNRHKALEMMRTQLDLQSRRELQGREFDTFVRLLRAYLKALDAEPEDTPAARRSRRLATQAEHINRFEAIQRLQRMTLDELNLAKHRPPDEFSDDNWRRLVNAEIKSRKVQSEQQEQQPEQPVEENQNGIQ